jgi:hypothetical protein
LKDYERKVIEKRFFMTQNGEKNILRRFSIGEKGRNIVKLFLSEQNEFEKKKSNLIRN